jgi:two-component system, NarL family, sensor histidine kinase DesK
VLRHSGARRCEIEVRRAGGEATLELRDDGTGGEAGAGGRSRGLGGSGGSDGDGGPDGRDGRDGSGLVGLAERVRAAGGRVDAGAVPAGGFALTVAVPLSMGEPAADQADQADQPDQADQEAIG